MAAVPPAAAVVAHPQRVVAGPRMETALGLLVMAVAAPRTVTAAIPPEASRRRAVDRRAAVVVGRAAVSNAPADPRYLARAQRLDAAPVARTALNLRAYTAGHE